MKYFSELTRQRMSEAAKQRCDDEWRKRQSEMKATALDTDKIKALYERGMTQAEIAAEMGVTQKVIWRHMKNHGISARVAAKREQSGAINHMWKGRDASYKAFHVRLKNKYGAAKDLGCSVCGRKDNDTSYNWANLTGRYSDISDYAPMCLSCHRKYDAKRRRELRCKTMFLR